MKQNSNLLKLLPIMFAFFCMGFVDMVGTATNYVKSDFGLNNTIANVLPMMVFFWFFIFSVPTGVLMGKIGRRKTVLLSLVVTFLALLVPVISYTYITMLISFSLLGIGNTLMQVSLNPLLSSIVTGEKLASSLTLGQFVKALASALAPLLAPIFAQSELFGYDWKVLYPIFMVISILAVLWLGMTSIPEQSEDSKGATFGQCFKLLGNSTIFLCFLGIMCHVGIDVGVNTTAPRILMERLGLDDPNHVAYATLVYFIFRTIGCFSGTFLLAHFAAKKVFVVSVVLMIVSMLGFFIFDNEVAICISIALVGLGNSNIFPVIFSNALLYMPDKKNEVSGLMIMGLVGGAVFPFIMGLATDAISSQAGALIVLSLGVLYLFFFSSKLKQSVK